MKISKISAAIAAAAMAVSMVAVSASATNWSTATYADNDPTEATIVSTDENKVVFKNNGNEVYVKCLVHLGDLIAPEDFSKIRSATWNVTYDIPADAPAGNGLSGGTYFMGKNSTGYWINADYDDAGNPNWSSGTYTSPDDAKFLMANEYESLTAESELVFMDWTANAGSDVVTNGDVTITVSDLKFFDADGNEIAQLPYAGGSSSAPAADTGAATTAPATGNVPAAVMASVMAVAGVAVVASRKRK